MNGMKLRAWAAALALTFAIPPAARADDYKDVVQSVSNMVGDDDAQQLVAAHDLELLNVMWEDTGRYEGSSVGPNISDVTIEVEGDSKTHERYLMPVMRHDDFVDTTGDVDLDKIWIPVGNQNGKKLKTISLKDLLADPTKYMAVPDGGTITGGTLLADRDTKALVSAQQTFLPVPKSGKATFWPVIFNYQSYQDNPAVLAILVTRQGTSMTIIDNNKDTIADGSSWGQRLFFDHDGQKAPLVAERKKDVVAKGKTANGEDASTLGDDANLMMIIQVPLVQAHPQQMAYPDEPMEEDGEDDLAPSAAGSANGAGAGGGLARDSRSSDVDTAVLGHGDDEGKFSELNGLTIQRDDRFPVRVTVQFYQATSNGVVSKDDVDAMAAQIEKVYSKADYVGSLVVPSPRDKQRTTRWTGDGPQPDALGWYSFPGLQERYRKYGWYWIPETQPERDPQIGIQ
jgi:hypothetical protein